MTQIGQRFGLSLRAGNGIFCSEIGLFVGDVPLLERTGEVTGQWRPRPLRDVNRDLGKRYGLPVEFERKIVGLSSVARALSNGDIVHAQIATLHLQIPDPPALRKSTLTAIEILQLARQLQASGLLKSDWDPAKHPRWPAKSPDSIGGQFAPADSAFSDSAPADSDARVIPVQGGTITLPPDLALPRAIPLPRMSPPSEIAPAFPNINPRDAPRNPYPDRPECEQEWADAIQYCGKLKARGLLGVGDYRGMGRTFRECVMGLVSEACGGNSTA